jgi:hypothetical protein
MPAAIFERRFLGDAAVAAIEDPEQAKAAAAA